MTKKITLVSTLVEILAPLDTNFYFEETDYMTSTLRLWLMGVDLVCIAFTRNNILHTSILQNFLQRRKHTKLSSSGGTTNQVLHKANSPQKNLGTSEFYNEKQSAMNYKVSSSKKTVASKCKKIRPNYFVAFQITDEEVHCTVKYVQEHILKQDKRLEKCLISRSTLHITLTVLHLKDSQDHSNALKALHAVHQQYNNILCDEPLKLEFTGMGHFGNKVLFVKIKENASYQRLCDITKSVHVHLEAVGLKTTDTRKEFNPHLTVAKIDFTNKSLKGIRKLSPSLYEQYIELPFGFSTVKSIQLLKMNGPKTSSGYYVGDELYFSKSDPVLWKKLNALMAIADKKKEIKTKISRLTEKLFK